MARSRTPLPPLATETNYVAENFQEFEYFAASLTGSEAFLRLHLKHGTTIDLPSSNDALKHLRFMLCEANETADHVEMRGWKPV